MRLEVNNRSCGQVISRAFVVAFAWFERTFSRPVVAGLFVLGITTWILLSVWS